MATMRDGLNTWLKQDCADIGDRLIRAISTLHLVGDIAKEIGQPDESVSLGRIGAAGYINLIIVNSSMSKTADLIPSQDDADKARHIIQDMQQSAQAKDKAGVFDNIERLKLMFTKAALEATVECQCGSPNYNRLNHIARIDYGLRRIHYFNQLTPSQKEAVRKAKSGESYGEFLERTNVGGEQLSEQVKFNREHGYGDEHVGMQESFDIGDIVHIIKGPLSGMVGTVKSVSDFQYYLQLTDGHEHYVNKQDTEKYK